MARWKLRCAHYLNVEGTEWEYSESGMGKRGRPAKVRFKVPRHLDPNEPADHTHLNWMNQGDGVIIVAHEGTTNDPNDVIFSGAPTPDMDPIDDEAMKQNQELLNVLTHAAPPQPQNGRRA